MRISDWSSDVCSSDLLNIGDDRVQYDPCSGMHQHCLAISRPRTRIALAPDGRFHMNERQRHEFGEAAGFFLQCTNTQQMPGPVAVLIDMAEHDRRRRAQRSEEDTSELHSLMRISNPVFCW